MSGYTSVNIITRQETGPCPLCGTIETLESLTVVIGDAEDTVPASCASCRVGHVQLALLKKQESGGPRPPSNRMKKLSQKQEKRVMQDIGGRMHKASGAAGDKGDGHLLDVVRVEMKYTFANSFKLGLDILEKIRGECRGKEIPSVVIDFKVKPTGRTVDSWAVIPYEVWKKVVNVLAENIRSE